MRLLLLALSFINLTILALSCMESNPATLDFGRLKYDANRIAIFKWDTTKYQFAANTSPLPLTQDDLRAVDSLIKDAIDSFNTAISPKLYQAFESKIPLDSFIIRYEKYKYQYFPFKNVNGKHVLTIIGFAEDFKQWKQEVYQARLHYGIRMLELEVDLTGKTHDTLRSGDFG